MPVPSRSAPRAVVVGGGVFGLAGTLELRRRGWSVTVIDPGPIPRPEASSTDVSKVVRMDYGGDALLTDLAAAALDGWEAWNRGWPRPLYHPVGFLLLRRGPLEPGSFEAESLRLLGERGVAVQRVGGALLARRFPAWNARVYPDGYLNPRGGWAESGEVVAWMAREAAAAGVRVVQGTAVSELLEEGGGVAGVATRDGQALRADRVVVAAGAWTPILLPWLGDVLTPVGQPVLHFRPPDPGPFRADRFPVWAADISRTGWYGFPALPDGSVKVAHHGPGTPVHPDAPRSVPDEHVERCRAFLRESLPGLADAPVVHRRLCLYCDAFDGDLLIAPDPDRPGLVVASGGSGHAFKFAPVLGGLVADAVEERESPWGGRFGWRARGPERREEARQRE